MVKGRFEVKNVILITKSRGDFKRPGFAKNLDFTRDSGIFTVQNKKNRAI